jgi:hypothetical protein
MLRFQNPATAMLEDVRALATPLASMIVQPAPKWNPSARPFGCMSRVPTPATLRSEPILLSWRRRIGAPQQIFFCSQQPAASCYNARSRSEPQRGVCFDARSARSSRSYWRTSRRARDYGSDAAVAPLFLGVHRAEGEVSFKKLVIRRQANPSETKETR